MGGGEYFIIKSSQVNYEILTHGGVNISLKNIHPGVNISLLDIHPPGGDIFIRGVTISLWNIHPRVNIWYEIVTRGWLFHGVNI